MAMDNINIAAIMLLAFNTNAPPSDAAAMHPVNRLSVTGCIAAAITLYVSVNIAI
jgi:hypothetical protein